MFKQNNKNHVACCYLKLKYFTNLISFSYFNVGVPRKDRERERGRQEKQGSEGNDDGRYIYS